MEDFFQKNYLFLTHTVEAMAALSGLVCFNKYKHTVARYFIFFLVFLTVCDFISGYTWLVDPGKLFDFLIGTLVEKNYWLSTLYWKIGAIIFFAFYFYQIIKNKRFKVTLKYSTISFFTFSLLYIIFHWQAFFVSFFPIISVLGAIIIFMCTSFYFFEILQSDKILNINKSLNFYISFAIFIWWLIITPIVFYDNYTFYEVGVDKEDLNYIILRRYIYLFSNIFMYSTFTFALIWCKPQND